MTPAILLVAFGALSESAREVYALIEADVRAAHPGHEIRWAWTAKSLVARMRERGEEAFTLEEALAAIQGPVAVLSLHLVPGQKHREIPAGLACSSPLLESGEDIEAVAQSLLAELPADRPALVVAHGHAHETRFNAELLALKTALAKARPDVHLALLEGDEDESGLEAFIARARACGKVHVSPFLLVAGDHVRNDILGDEPDSLKSRLGVADFTCGEELGRKAWVRQRFLARLKTAMNELEGA